MKKLISASILAGLALTMLLPVAGRVNASSARHLVLRQGLPMPTGGGGGHVIFRQGLPMPTGGGGGH
jgi:hypothetical protein